MKKQYKSKKFIILSIIRMLFFVLLIVSAFYIIKWYISNEQNRIVQEKVSEAISIGNVETELGIDSNYNVDFTKLKEINKDVVAWLKVNGTNIEYAVVKTNNNNYYLNHNFENKQNGAGWIFADYKNKLDGTDKNIVIYGHNMRDSSMFGTLKNILEEEWYNNEENYVINFVTEKEEQKYQVFSVYQIKNEDYYIDTEFKNNEFKEVIDELKNRSVKEFDVEILDEDTILTLSTCANNNKYRVVLHAKMINI